MLSVQWLQVVVDGFHLTPAGIGDDALPVSTAWSLVLFSAFGVLWWFPVGVVPISVE